MGVPCSVFFFIVLIKPRKIRRCASREKASRLHVGVDRDDALQSGTYIMYVYRTAAKDTVYTRIRIILVCRDFRPCTLINGDGRRYIIAGSRVRRVKEEIYTRVHVYNIVATYDPRLSRRRQPPLPNRQLDRFGGRAGARRRRCAQPL